jgi:hypothetical protein
MISRIEKFRVIPMKPRWIGDLRGIDYNDHDWCCIDLVTT